MKTQKIHRKHLQEIFSKVCESWQKEITTLVLFQSGDYVEIEKNLLDRAYEAASISTDKSHKLFIEKHFNIFNIKDRVKTWKDVLKESRFNEEDILPYSKPKTKEQVSQNAFAKIQLISKVLNEGWMPDFKNSNESKYYPYFERKAHGWVLSSGSFSYGNGFSDLGFGCLYKNSDLAIYAGTQFLEIYKEYLPE